MDFKQRILADKRVSVWSLGYLGYTTLLCLQSKGFCADVYDIIAPDRVKELLKGDHPVKDYNERWSSRGDIPPIDLTKIHSAVFIEKMFSNPVHIVTFPGVPESGNKNWIQELAGCFLKNTAKANDSLVIFQSAETPGSIQQYFIDILRSHDVHCHYAAAFRTDWSIEELFSQKRKQVIAGYDNRALEKVMYLFDLFEQDYDTLSSIVEAEIYENTRKSLQYTISAFVNQIGLSYPNIDIRKMSRILLNENLYEDIYLSIGAMDYKSAAAASHLLSGSRYSALLTLLHDAQSANVYSILRYAELICERNIGQVTILGITDKGDLKDIRLSPSLILVASLVEADIEVSLHDPYFSEEEISVLAPKAVYVEDIETCRLGECIVLMTPHRMYRYLSQNDVDNSSLSSAALIIDNPGIWKHLRFSKDTLYHIPGDGKFEGLSK